MKWIIFAAMVFTTTSWAKDASLTCHTPRKLKAFSISKNSITLFQEKTLDPNRSLASLENVNTKIHKGGFTKSLMFEGIHYKIHINNMDKLSPLEDYLIMRSREGHEIIYPLNCEIN